MLTVEHINNLSQILKKNDSDRKNVLKYAKEIINCKEYIKWFTVDEFDQQPFEVPEYIFAGNDNLKRIFDDFGLIEDEYLQVRITEIENHIHFTDGLWVPPRFRVFPFTDESERLTEYLKQENLLDWADLVVDPATGCGHHVNVLRNVKYKIAADINYRAIAFCDLNRILNNNRNVFVSVHNIQDGMPIPFPEVIEGNILFVINMPFALAPAERVLPISANGGSTGAKMTFAALDSLAKFSKSANENTNIRAVILNYSIGNVEDNVWEIEKRASDLFGAENTKFRLLTMEKMWRINGKKEQPNPMPIESICKKADCKYYVTDSIREEVKEGYKNLQWSLIKGGWNALGYGILDIDLS